MHNENSVTDEDQENVRAMTSEEEEENHKHDMRKLVEMVHKEDMELEMTQKEEMQQEEQRGRVALNIGAGGSHLPATSDPREEEAEERRKGTRRPRWADCKTTKERKKKNRRQNEKGSKRRKKRMSKRKRKRQGQKQGTRS